LIKAYVISVYMFRRLIYSYFALQNVLSTSTENKLNFVNRKFDFTAFGCRHDKYNIESLNIWPKKKKKSGGFSFCLDLLTSKK